MKRYKFYIFCLMVAVASCTSPAGSYLMIPVEDSAPQVEMTVVSGDSILYVADVRLSDGAGSYCVPFDMGHFGVEASEVFFDGVPSAEIKGIRHTERPDEIPADKFRPVYHHTPEYGWMNDANGLFFKDGVYHLYYQYNPFASVWGNMHWGHSTSKDLVHWKHQPIALYRDTYGHIFSGSTVVDSNNTAGFGEGAVVTFYTSHNAEREYTQTQCLAYSLDDGVTFTKYEGNPVLVPYDGIKDFRDPKVFWYAPDGKWVMVVSADREMRFYSSLNLKEWNYMSAWGDGYGVQPRQFECPDLFPLTTVDGVTKWVMIVNVNPGCYFGGSATQYFVGEFDGTSFVCDSPKETVKWLDWGKDHYAAVTFFGTDGRVIAVPWMSNWQYGAVVPTKYFRSANAFPRELGLYNEGEDFFVSVNPVPEISAIEKDSRMLDNFEITDGSRSVRIFDSTDGAYELQFGFSPKSSSIYGFKLTNTLGESVDCFFEQDPSRFVMDRTLSGDVSFGEKSVSHALENHDRRKDCAVNYVNDFALATWSPVSAAETHDVRILSDNSSLEVFIDGGHVAMTNLVFPQVPYNQIEFYVSDGSALVENLKITALAL